MTMKMLTRLAPAALLALAACSSSGQLKVLDPAAQMAPSYDSAKLVLQASATDAAAVIPDIRGAVAGQLFASGRFHRLAAESEASDVVITVKINEYARVETVERVVAGVLAGRNRVGAEVVVTDGRTGAVLRHYQAHGESASHPMSTEGSFSDAVREFSKEVAVGLSA